MTVLYLKMICLEWVVVMDEVVWADHILPDTAPSLSQPCTEQHQPVHKNKTLDRIKLPLCCYESRHLVRQNVCAFLTRTSKEHAARNVPVLISTAQVRTHITRLQQPSCRADI